MARLTEEMVIARSRASDLASIKKLNCWGSDLSDITLLRRMLSVEVLSLSVNKINSLADFQYCRNLQELYVRKNEIRDLNEVCYLQELPNLKCLWLADNPCADVNLYRPTVLKALPRLQKLDNVAVEPEEVQDAMRRGLDLYHPEEQQPPTPSEYESTNTPRRKAVNHSPQASPSDSPQGSPEQCWTLRPETPVHHHQQSPSNGHEEGFEEQGECPNEEVEAAEEETASAPLVAPSSSPCADDVSGEGSAQPQEDVDPERRSPPRRLQRQSSERDMEISEGTIRRGPSGFCPTTPNDDDLAYYDNDRRNANNCEQPEYGYGRQVTSYSSSYDIPAQCGFQGEEEQQHYERVCRQQMQQSQHQRPTGLHLQSSGKPPSSRSNAGRPKTRSNVLSAILCLLKELDYPSLEVVEMAVRSRMDEFED
ncbi:acidic leucine-rich nuclear phosphoprotein 32 family member B-like isoform X2 [Ischnura elegans]|uniref:acidic leucine-rich nuclear phosphoprotein 32 family member B-like isoform X2 n=1 Tax=Ischnura elegans TaxID=197161 RepID=UPI001ED8929F|nr:acidic leucine-rich nuclear phosphoprotein 32 family member B-like isoform X2 [Ischnura elegans]